MEKMAQNYKNLYRERLTSEISERKHLLEKEQLEHENEIAHLKLLLRNKI